MQDRCTEMKEKIQKKLMNGYLLADLPKMAWQIPKNFSKVMQVQNQRVHALAKRAWEIPFYRERFTNCVSGWDL